MAGHPANCVRLASTASNLSPSRYTAIPDGLPTGVWRIRCFFSKRLELSSLRIYAMISLEVKIVLITQITTEDGTLPGCVPCGGHGHEGRGSYPSFFINSQNILVQFLKFGIPGVGAKANRRGNQYFRMGSEVYLPGLFSRRGHNTSRWYRCLRGLFLLPAVIKGIVNRFWFWPSFLRGPYLVGPKFPWPSLHRPRKLDNCREFSNACFL